MKVAVAAQHRDCVRRPLDLRLEQLDEIPGRQLGSFGAVPIDFSLTAFSLRQKRQLGYMLARIVANTFKQSLELPSETMDSGGVEKVGVELPRHRHAFVDFSQIEGEVEFRGFVVDPKRPRGETGGEIEGRSCEEVDPRSRRARRVWHVLEGEHDLEQRRPAQIARDAQDFP